MLHLVHRTTVKLQTVNIETCMDPVPSSFRTRNAQGINVANYDVIKLSELSEPRRGLIVLFTVSKSMYGTQ